MYQRPGTIYVQSNGLGTAGFVCSLLGLLTCGILCPVGLLMSLVAAFWRPRGMAMAGILIGALGSTVPIALFGLFGFGAWTQTSGRAISRLEELAKKNPGFSQDIRAATAEVKALEAGQTLPEVEWPATNSPERAAVLFDIGSILLSYQVPAGIRWFERAAAEAPESPASARARYILNPPQRQRD